MNSFLKVLIIILLISIATSNFLINPNFREDNEFNKNEHTIDSSINFKTEFTKSLITTLPIKIENNNDFLLYSFSGNGTIDNPYLIENFLISNDSSILIYIINTSSNFIIRNNTLNGISGEYDGIYLENIANCQILNNSISNVKHGIYLEESQNNHIQYNLIQNCTTTGIHLLRSQYNLLLTNQLYSNRFGFYLNSFSSENSIINNSIANNYYRGITITGISCSNIISGNIINNNTRYGISMHQGCFRNIIKNNNISNSQAGIYTYNSINNNITANNIFENQLGVYLTSYSSRISVTENIFFDNSNYSICLGNEEFPEPVDYCLVMWNEFINNTQNGKSQAFDLPRNDGLESKNTFVFNYWNDWNTPDNDQDGIVDNPYLIDGSGIFDQYPQSFRKNITEHLLSEPKVFIPEIYSDLDEKIVKWTKAIDSFGFLVSYSLYYSNDLGNTWNSIIIDTKGISFIWNISLLVAGCYQLKILATSEGGLSTETFSDNFPLKVEHSLSSPQIIVPFNSSTYSENIVIQWTPAFDNCYYSVSYNISYSIDGGDYWTLIASEINTTSFEWDTTSVEDGDNYKLKVVAFSEGGLVSSIITNNTFSIFNDLSISNPEPFFVSFPFLELLFSLFIISEILILSFLLKFIKKSKLNKN